MYFSTALLAGALAVLASAQNEFTMATIPTTIKAGTPFNITWDPTTPGTVSIFLVQAESAGSTIVHPVDAIASNITNSGSFDWTPASTIPQGTGYALEIVDDANANLVNYCPQFGIESSTTASPSSSGSAGVSSASAAAGSSMSGAASSAPSAAAQSTAVSGNKTVATTMATKMTPSASSSATESASSPSLTAVNFAAVETARAGVGLLAAVGAVMLLL